MKIGFSTSVIQRGKTGVAQYFFGLLRAFDAAPSEHQFVLFALQEDLHFFKNYSSRFEIVPVNVKYRPHKKYSVAPGTIAAAGQKP